jgi:putative transposase
MSDYRRYFVPGGTYFFTVVTYRRYPFFKSEQAREFLKKGWQDVRNEMPFANVASVLLPDHFHCLWTLPPDDKNYSLRLKKIKDALTGAWLDAGGHEVPVTPSQKRRGNRGIWQRRFWEHTIRDETDFENHFDYIHFNPVKHGYVSNAIDWPYSTFHRYAKSGHYPPTWGRQCPTHIENMDLE